MARCRLLSIYHLLLTIREVRAIVQVTAYKERRNAPEADPAVRFADPACIRSVAVDGGAEVPVR